jgi:hypothetical protein
MMPDISERSFEKTIECSVVTFADVDLEKLYVLGK